MDFISNQETQIQEMLKDLGLSDLEPLFAAIPKEIKESPPLKDDGLSEYEGKKWIQKIAQKNTGHEFDCYLGAGAYEHHIPALVRFITAKSGFMTAYTPYQAEASQGLLQTIYEFQSVIGRITGLDVANASLYDGASASAEALLMMSRLQPKRKQLLVAGNLHPHYLKVIEQYTSPLALELKKIPTHLGGQIHEVRYEELLSEEVAGVLFGYPNFFGSIDPLETLIKKAKAKGILVALCANPLIYGLFQSASELGADIAVGDLQPLGLPLQFGGPYAGYFACKKEFVRQLPGRLVGKSKGQKGELGYVLTLQTREQHIRREKATSNICSNQALSALASLVTLLWYGPKGFKELALTNYQKSEYLKSELAKLSSVELFCDRPTFNEFVIKVPQNLQKTFDHFRYHGIEPGLSLARWYPELSEHLLISVTETKSEKQLKRYLEVAKKIW